MVGRQIARRAIRQRLLRPHHDGVGEAAQQHDQREQRIHDADFLVVDRRDPLATRDRASSPSPTTRTSTPRMRTAPTRGRCETAESAGRTEWRTRSACRTCYIKSPGSESIEESRFFFEKTEKLSFLRVRALGWRIPKMTKIAASGTWDYCAPPGETLAFGCATLVRTWTLRNLFRCDLQEQARVGIGVREGRHVARSAWRGRRNCRHPGWGHARAWWLIQDANWSGGTACTSKCMSGKSVATVMAGLAVINVPGWSATRFMRETMPSMV